MPVGDLSTWIPPQLPQLTPTRRGVLSGGTGVVWPIPPTRIRESQVALEVFTAGTSEERASQFVLEIFRADWSYSLWHPRYTDIVPRRKLLVHGAMVEPPHDPTLGHGFARLSNAPIVTARRGSATARVSNAPLVTARRGDPTARLSNAPLIVMKQTLPTLPDTCSMEAPTYFSILQTNESTPLTSYAERALNDPATWYGGPKEPRILSIGRVQRMASDVLTGAWTAQRASIKVADTDFFYRALDDVSTSRASTANGIPNIPDATTDTDRSLWLYLVSESIRRAQGTPRLVFRGMLYDNPITEHLTATLEANDLIGVTYDLFAFEPKLPKRVIGLADFPDCLNVEHQLPQTNSGEPLGVPIIYGDVSDEASASPTGQVQLLNVGALTLNGVSYPAVGLLSGHACKAIYNIYKDGTVVPSGDYGTYIWAPGRTGWSTIVPTGESYVDINGNRYTLIPMTGYYADALKAGAQFTVNVAGIESTSDGTGTLLTNLFFQYRHLLVNWIFDGYTSGRWLYPPTFRYGPPTGIGIRGLDMRSFEDANYIVSSQYGATLSGGFVLGAGGIRKPVRQVMQDMHLCLPNVLMRMDKYQRIGLVALNRSASQVAAAARSVDWRLDILKRDRSLTKRKDWNFNTIAYRYGNNWHSNEMSGSGSVADSSSVSRYGVKKLTRDFLHINDSAVASMVATQQLAMLADPPQTYTWSESLCGLRHDVLDYVSVTDYEGSGSSGYNGRKLWLIQQTLDPESDVVTNVAVDIESLLS